MLTKTQYLEVLHGLEVQLWRHAGPWGNLPGDGHVQKMKDSWEALARSFEEDHPAGHAPMPFWKMRRQPILCILRKDDAQGGSGPDERPPKQG